VADILKEGRKMAIPYLKYSTASEITVIDSLTPTTSQPLLRTKEVEILHSLQKRHQFQLRLNAGLTDLTVAQATGVVSLKVAG
jgi:hypothetical protein